ncbi:MAG: hypothetical protein E7347_05135 [Clostridiales bacterium]|nr:hypothetical protein [Clostridiales bacterium]
MINNIDREFIENKYHLKSEPFNPHRRMEYHGYNYPNNGLTDKEIIDGLREYALKLEGLPRPVIKARAIEYVLKNTKIDVNEHDYFIGIYSWNRLAEKITYDKWIRELFASIPKMNTVMQDFVASGAMSLTPDFDHVIPSWDSLMDLGFKGILDRVVKYENIHKENETLTEQLKGHFDGVKIAYQAVIDFIDRLYNFALKQNHEKSKTVANCLKNLRDGAPQNFFDALQMIYIYFMLSESVDSYQVRSLGHGLDGTLYKFYKQDLENGTFTREEMKNFLSYFLMQWTGIGNYWGQPTYIAGTNLDGTTKVNELTYLILDVYEELGIYNPKVQVKVNHNTPKEFVLRVCDMIRKGQTCFVFCCEPGFVKAMMEYGLTYEEAYNFDISGCYESKARADEVATGCAGFNMLKPVLYALNNGYDNAFKKQIGVKTGDISTLKTFDDFYFAFIKQSDYLFEEGMEIIKDFEQHLGEVNPSLLYSGTIERSLAKGVDGYQCGVKFNNSGIGISGFASAIDALMVIKKFVYEDKIVTLEQLKTALDNDWVGYENLRYKILNSKFKYGNDEPETDALAKSALTRVFEKVNNMPNSRGGVFKSEMHSALEFVRKGQRTSASPDGRKFGEELSKNASPSVGADREGVTALINSALKLLPYKHHEGFCLDIMLHPTTVQGDEGLETMYSLIKTYMQNGGMSLQMNIFNEEMLVDAQNNPKKYENLQVRVCGWNVLWNNLSKEEQDAYILRAKNIQY